MRTRDLKKLKPGQKLLVRLSKEQVRQFSHLAKWNNRIVYFDRHLNGECGCDLAVRSSKKIRSSTSHMPLTIREVIVVHDLDTAVLSLRFNGRR